MILRIVKLQIDKNISRKPRIVLGCRVISRREKTMGLELMQGGPNRPRTDYVLISEIISLTTSQSEFVFFINFDLNFEIDLKLH